MNIISLGAGVQSSTMALMAAAGEITPMPDCAIFADTQAEPKAVYEWLDWLERELPFPVYRVTKGNLGVDTIINRISKKTGQTYTRNMIPAFTYAPNEEPGIHRRICTVEYKVCVIEKKIRELTKDYRKTLMAATSNEPVVSQWIGISVDEASRMKPATIMVRKKKVPHPFIKNQWPLIEIGMSRNDCFRWMEKHGYPKPPRSACIFCPYHNDNEWRRLKAEEPEEFKKAVQYERDLQLAESRNTGTAKMRSVSFLHPTLIPLDQVDFSTEEDHGQLNMFNNECLGLCGT